MKINRQLVAVARIDAINLLVQQVPELSKGRLKDAMNKGAVLWQKGAQKKRLRRAQSPLQPGEILHLHYDDDILHRQCAEAVLLAEQPGFSLWYKPAGMLSQGNEWGDHLALLRVAELAFNSRKPVFLVHRLDREASGLLLIAHQKSCAAALSLLMQQQKISKTYRVVVKGHLSASLLQQGQIELPLDGKPSLTRFKRLAELQTPARTLLEIELISGRKHQIRRHFAAVDHPVMGDPRYGEQNKDANGLALQAVAIQFQLPKQLVFSFQLPEIYRLSVD